MGFASPVYSNEIKQFLIHSVWLPQCIINPVLALTFLKETGAISPRVVHSGCIVRVHILPGHFKMQDGVWYSWQVANQPAVLRRRPIEKGTGSADLVLLAREFLREPYWPIKAANELGVLFGVPDQYARAYAKPK
jgi:hypothetical protein